MCTLVDEASRITGITVQSGQILLGHRKMESTVRYLGIEVDDALELAAQPTFLQA